MEGTEGIGICIYILGGATISSSFLFPRHPYIFIFVRATLSRQKERRAILYVKNIRRRDTMRYDLLWFIYSLGIDAILLISSANAKLILLLRMENYLCVCNIYGRRYEFVKRNASISVTLIRKIYACINQRAVTSLHGTYSYSRD